MQDDYTENFDCTISFQWLDSILSSFEIFAKLAKN